MDSVMKKCVKACKDCKKMDMKDCRTACGDCEILCSVIADCISKISDDSLKKSLYKLVIKACKKCIKVCSKYDHKKCKAVSLLFRLTVLFNIASPKEKA